MLVYFSIDLKKWGKIEFHCIQHTKVLQPTAKWGIGVLLLHALVSEVLNWCKVVGFWVSKVKDCQHSLLSPPQDPQYAKTYLSQVSMEEYRKRVLADAVPVSSVFRWRSLCGEVIYIYLFVSIYSVTSSQLSPMKQSSLLLRITTFWLPSICFLLNYLILLLLLLEDVVSLYFLPPWPSWLCRRSSQTHSWDRTQNYRPSLMSEPQRRLFLPYPG